MFDSSKAMAREAFDAQFEEVAGGVDFRPGGIGEPYRLTAAEQAEAQAAFDRTMGWLPWAMTGTAIVLIGLMVLFDLDVDSAVAPTTLAIVAVVTGGYVLAFRRAMHAPARIYAGRQVPGDARSKAEVRAAQLRKMSWAQIGGGGIVFLVLMGLQLQGEDPGSTAFQTWLVFGVAGLAVMLTTVIRKLRLPPED